MEMVTSVMATSIAFRDTWVRSPMTVTSAMTSTPTATLTIRTCRRRDRTEAKFCRKRELTIGKWNYQKSEPGRRAIFAAVLLCCGALRRADTAGVTVPGYDLDI